MRNQFDEQLDLLNVELIRMGALCEEAIGLATRALLEGSAAAAEKAVAVDTEIDQKEREIEQVHIADMAKATGKMVTDSIDSFVKKDLELAYSVMRYDDVVDGLFSAVRRELIGLISEDSRNGELCIDLLMIAKYFERIGDHAVNIAEWVEFSLTGKHTSNEGV